MNTKERLAKYLESIGMSKYRFQKITGMPNGFFNSGANVTSANLDVITDKFGDLSLVWLIKGIGPMTIPNRTTPVRYSDGSLKETGILNESGCKAPESQSEVERLEDVVRNQLIEMNKMMKEVLQSTRETVQAKDEIMAKLQRLIDEKGT